MQKIIHMPLHFVVEIGVGVGCGAWACIEEKIKHNVNDINWTILVYCVMSASLNMIVDIRATDLIKSHLSPGKTLKTAFTNNIV
jgi:hypothetical protein